MLCTVLRVCAATVVGFIGYHIHDTDARADDWGCQVLLCISNPGGPTEFAACRPPISRLWKELGKGHSFPKCSGAAFKASRPGYDPYFCDAGYQLRYRDKERHREAACVSMTLQSVSSDMCPSPFDMGGVRPGRWFNGDAGRVCKAAVTRRPHAREKARFIDLTIDGIGDQRVWY